MDAGVPSLGSRDLACGGLLSWCGGRPRADLEWGLHGTLPVHMNTCLAHFTLLLDPRKETVC